MPIAYCSRKFEGEEGKEQSARNQYRNVLRSEESSPGNAIQYLLQLPLLRSALPSRRSIGFPCLPPPPSERSTGPPPPPPFFSSILWTFLVPSVGQTRRRRRRRKRRRRRRRWWWWWLSLPFFSFPPLNLFLLRDIFPIFPLFSPLLVLLVRGEILFPFLLFLSSFLSFFFKKRDILSKKTRGE